MHFAFGLALRPVRVWSSIVQHSSRFLQDLPSSRLLGFMANRVWYHQLYEKASSSDCSAPRSSHIGSEELFER
uniref:Secreted protein n=1 Tax=Haemonchus contortus TaxID=6289 RepID=A0A7I4Z1S1_HAECO